MSLKSTKTDEKMFLDFRMDQDLILEALYEVEEQVRVLQNIMDNMPSLVGYWDANLINKFANQAYLDFFGKSRDEVEGQHVRDVLGEDLFKQFYPQMERALHGEKITLERTFPMANGEFRYFQAHYVPDSREGRVHGVFVLIFDVSPLKMAAQEREKIYQQLSESYKMVSLGEMAGGVAHEINTPLGIISINVSLAKKTLENPDVDREKLRKFLTAIERTTDRISKIVTGLLLFSKDRKGEAYRSTPLASILEETLPFCNEKFKNHGVAFHYAPPPANLAIECHPVEISQVLVNLLNNAYDAIENISDRWIAMDITEDGEFVEIGVADSGPGIPANVREKLMQPFFTTKETGKGTGLGLSISKGIVETHGGSLELDGRSGNTRFVVRLPKKHKIGS